jgi:hypothetical protein
MSLDLEAIKTRAKQALPDWQGELPFWRCDRFMVMTDIDALIAELSAARAVVEAFRIVAQEIPDMGDYWGGYIDETYPPEDWAILRAGVEALADYEKVGK